METTRKDLIAIALGFILAAALAGVVVLSQPSKPVVKNVAPVVDVNSTSSVLVTTTIKPAASTIPAKAVKHMVQSTTTSEVPAPLTPGQEAKIPGPEADPDLNEHMPTDYPYEDMDYETPAP